MDDSIGDALTEGLLRGYAGTGEITSTLRGDVFQGKVSHALIGGGVYHDEWFVHSYLGGGQELVQVSGQTYTRLYAGGTQSPEQLERLGITVKQVGGYLKKKITELGQQTRLFEDCRPTPDGDWVYRYEILLQDPNIPVVTAAESIYYKGERVHLHPFILSPIK